MSAAVIEAAFSVVDAVGAGDSVRSVFAFFFRAALDSAEAGGFWISEDAILYLFCNREWCCLEALVCFVFVWFERLTKFPRSARNEDRD